MPSAGKTVLTSGVFGVRIASYGDLAFMSRTNALTVENRGSKAGFIV